MKRYDFKKLGATLALAGLVVRLAVAFLHVPTALAADIAAASQNSGGFILVYCTVHGTIKFPAKTVGDSIKAGDDTQDPANPTDQPGAVHPPLCPICHAVGMAETGIETGGAPVLTSPRVLRERFVVARTDVAPRTNAIRLSARGPPAATLS